MIINNYDFGESLDTDEKRALYESFMISSLQDLYESFYD